MFKMHEMSKTWTYNKICVNVRCRYTEHPEKNPNSKRIWWILNEYTSCFSWRSISPFDSIFMVISRYESQYYINSHYRLHSAGARFLCLPKWPFGAPMPTLEWVCLFDRKRIKCASQGLNKPCTYRMRTVLSPSDCFSNIFILFHASITEKNILYTKIPSNMSVPR